MHPCISVRFEFKGKEYYAIVRQSTFNNRILYRIRIMNHRLDALLHKANLNIIEASDDRLVLPEMKNQKAELMLLMSVAKGMSMQLFKTTEEKPFHFITDFELLTPF